MNAFDKFQGALAVCPLVAILRGLQPADAHAIGEALVTSGWKLIEVPLNSPDAMRSIAALVKAFPDALVGAGTVLQPEQVREVHAAGGQMVVAPNFNAEVVREAVRLGMVCLPGVLTPTEAFAALAAGASGLKLFPAEMIGPAAVKALRAVLPAEALVPVSANRSVPVSSRPGQPASPLVRRCSTLGLAPVNQAPGSSRMPVWRLMPSTRPRRWSRFSASDSRACRSSETPWRRRNSSTGPLTACLPGGCCSCWTPRRRPWSSKRSRASFSHKGGFSSLRPGSHWNGWTA